MAQKTAGQLRVTQRAMERIMLGITRRDRFRTGDIRNRTKVTDIINRIARLKWHWVRYVARERETTRGAGRLQKRWIEDVKNIAGRELMRTARKKSGNACKRPLPSSGRTETKKKKKYSVNL